MKPAICTTRGVPFDPKASLSQREAIAQLRRSQEERSYREYTPGQERYRRAHRKAA